MQRTVSQRLETQHCYCPIHQRVWVGLLTLVGEVCTGAVGLMGLIGAGIVLYVGLHQCHFNFLFLSSSLILGYLGWIIWRSLQSIWVPPQGIALAPEDVPQVMAWIAQFQNQSCPLPENASQRRLAQKSSKSPIIHRILLTDDFNASIVQLPRLAILGGHHNYLLIGLPMLSALSPEQFQAILAHELGHLCHRQGQFAGWVYRRYQRKAFMLARLQSSRHSTMKGLWIRCLQWYVPYLGKKFLAIARLDEYRADRYAADCTDAATLAAALTQLHLKARYLKTQFWTTIFAQAAHHSDPPKQLFTELAAALQTQVDAAYVHPALNAILTQRTTVKDTHPCLSDRLAAFGIAPHQVKLQFPLPQTAAQALLGQKLNYYTTLLSREWYANLRFQWRSRYTHCQRLLTAQRSLAPHARSSAHACSNLKADDEFNVA